MKEKFTLENEDGGALLNLSAETSEDAIKELESRGILIDVQINEAEKKLICIRPIEHDYDSEMEEFWENQEISKNENELDDVVKEQQEREAHEQEIQIKLDKFVSYVDANCSKKITSATVKDAELTIEVYGGLDDMQIEKIQDNFNWINGLVFNNDKLVVFHLDM